MGYGIYKQNIHTKQPMISKDIKFTFISIRFQYILINNDVVGNVSGHFQLLGI